jgi:hypothetical protein
MGGVAGRNRRALRWGRSSLPLFDSATWRPGSTYRTGDHALRPGGVQLGDGSEAQASRTQAQRCRKMVGRVVPSRRLEGFG